MPLARAFEMGDPFLKSMDNLVSGKAGNSTEIARTGESPSREVWKLPAETATTTAPVMARLVSLPGVVVDPCQGSCDSLY